MNFNFVDYSSNGTNTVAHTLTLPAGITAGEVILVAYVDAIGTGNPATPSGYTSLFRQFTTNGRRGGVFGKIAAGGEASVLLDWGVNSASVVSATTVRISGGGPSALNEIEFAFVQNNGFATPINNPPSLTSAISASNYGWFTFIGGLSSSAFSAGPTGYTGFTSISSNDGAGTDGVMGYAYTETGLSTENPDPFSHPQANFQTLAVTVSLPDTQAASGPSITPSDPVVDGAEATISASGLTGDITATLGGYPLALAGTLPNLTYTLDIASITVNGPVSAPRIGETLTLSVAGDEGEATSTVAFNPSAGRAAVTLAGTLSNEADSLIDKMQNVSGLTVAVPDVMYYPTADNTDITTTGFLTSDSPSFTLILIKGGDADTAGSAYAFTVTPEAVTPVDPGDFPITRSVVKSVTRSVTKSIYRG